MVGRVPRGFSLSDVPNSKGASEALGNPSLPPAFALFRCNACTPGVPTLRKVLPVTCVSLLVPPRIEVIAGGLLPVAFGGLLDLADLQLDLSDFNGELVALFSGLMLFARPYRLGLR